MHLADRHVEWSLLNQPPAILDRHDGALVRNGRDRVCIFGAGGGLREAPLMDPAWDVWALNTVPPLDRDGRLRADLWWDVHQREAQSADDLRWIAALPMPVMVPDDLMDLGPHCVRYPVERVEAHVAPGPFACTFAMQIAYALLVGYRTIGLYGVELAWGDRRERTVEWASVSWWMGFAEARGVRFALPSASWLGRHPFCYGLDYRREKEAVADYVATMRQFDDEKPRRGIGG